MIFHPDHPNHIIKFESRSDAVRALSEVFGRVGQSRLRFDNSAWHSVTELIPYREFHTLASLRVIASSGTIARIMCEWYISVGLDTYLSNPAERSVEYVEQFIANHKTSAHYKNEKNYMVNAHVVNAHDC